MYQHRANVKRRLPEKPTPGYLRRCGCLPPPRNSHRRSIGLNYWKRWGFPPPNANTIPLNLISLASNVTVTCNEARLLIHQKIESQTSNNINTGQSRKLPKHVLHSQPLHAANSMEHSHPDSAIKVPFRILHIISKKFLLWSLRVPNYFPQIVYKSLIRPASPISPAGFARWPVSFFLARKLDST